MFFECLAAMKFSFLAITIVSYVAVWCGFNLRMLPVSFVVEKEVGWEVAEAMLCLKYRFLGVLYNWVSGWVEPDLCSF